MTRTRRALSPSLLALGVASCAAHASPPRALEVGGASAQHGARESRASDAPPGEAPRRSTLRPLPTGSYTAFVELSREDACSESFASTSTRARVTLTVDGGKVRVEVRGTQRSIFGSSPFASSPGTMSQRERALEATLDGRQRLGRGDVKLSLAEGTLLECEEGPVDVVLPDGKAHDEVAGFVCKVGREVASLEDKDDAEALAVLGERLVFGLDEPLTVSVSNGMLGGGEDTQVRRADERERALLDVR